MATFDRTCEQCGNGFQTPRSQARFCSSTCRSRANRGKPATPAVGGAKTDDAPAGLLTRTVESELKELGVLELISAQLAVALARRIDSAQDTGSAVATMAKQLQALVGEAKASASAAKVDAGAALEDSVAAKIGRFAS